ncbi:UbiA prenyltransferase family [Stachybotrys elegans]|uniref:UbiA prenyltransferase family n=1 Tax=Stachybotrys elegans TaxID=80388 RepID=A0A8K0WPC2_9HYPO|nr:UbiA prenyltransferase family [Stachybotrys elegans]
MLQGKLSEHMELKEAMPADPMVERPPYHGFFRLFYHVKTVFLFTKSDYKTILLPQATFAISAAVSGAQLTTTWSEDGGGGLDAVRLAQMLAWIWVNLLVEDIANQRLEDAIAEDQINKPWRPLPAGRLTPEEARDWLMASIVMSVAVSAAMGALTPTLSLLPMVWMYNDLHGSSSGFLIRNILNGCGLMNFSWGSLHVLAGGELLPRGVAWIAMTGSIVMTTIHAQDLPDQEGDKARGRRTIPLTLGQRAARWSLVVTVLFWSLAAPVFWGASLQGGGGCWWVSVPAVGSAMVWLAVQRWGQEWDEVVWKLWCLWMAMIYALPVLV